MRQVEHLLVEPVDVQSQNHGAGQQLCGHPIHPTDDTGEPEPQLLLVGGNPTSYSKPLVESQTPPEALCPMIRLLVPQKCLPKVEPQYSG